MGFFADGQDQLVAGKPRQVGRLSYLVDDLLQIGCAELRHAPALVDGAAKLKEMIAEAVLAVAGILL